jgi:hypothetical protein
MAVSKGPVWCVELHGSGHLAFLDEGAKGVRAMCLALQHMNATDTKAKSLFG